jgi:beta-lactamase regulating signal transducer with metallopeptidase domain
MIRQLSTLAAHPHLVLVGWSLLLVLCQTTAVALVLALWRFMRPAATARAQYAASLSAFGACVLLALVTPLTLSYASRQPIALSSDVVTSVAAGTRRAVAATVGLVAGQGTASPSLYVSAFIGWFGELWLCGVAVLGIRLIGGWVVAERVRRAARPISTRNLQETIARVLDEARITDPVAVLESDHVEAPVALGWRRPAVILPRDMADQLPRESLRPVVAHEVAHIARSDYAVNVMQSVVDVLLFFSPGVWWISRTIREAREYCCDDLAASDCTDRRAYVRGLTAMAALGSAHRRRPALGAAGPRLIVRIRRLLQEEHMSSVSRVRILVVGVSLVAVVPAGMSVAAASREAISQTARASASTGSSIDDNGTPINFAFEQPGSGIRMTSMTSSASEWCYSAVLHNDNDVPVTAVTFVGVVSSRGGLGSEVAIITGDPVTVSIPARGSATVPIGLLSPEQAEAAKDGPIQVMCGIERVRFANGAEWSVTPNPAATTTEEALGFPNSRIPRALVISGGKDDGQLGSRLCRDDRQQTYSPGAIVEIQHEPGRLARCVDGEWVETTGGQP